MTSHFSLLIGQKMQCLAEIMVMTCDMRGPKKNQLSGPIVHSLCFDLVGRKESPGKNLVRSAQIAYSKWSNDLLYQLTLRNFVCTVGLDWSFNVAFFSWILRRNHHVFLKCKKYSH